MDDLGDVNKDLDSSVSELHPLLSRPSNNEIIRLSRKIIDTIIAKAAIYPFDENIKKSCQIKCSCRAKKD